MDQEKVDQIFGLIEESLDEDHTFQMETILEDIDWDSIAALTFMSLVDESFNYAIPPDVMEDAETIEDLVNAVRN